MSDSANEIDVNDAFDAIVFAEQKIADEAFTEGVRKGTSDGLIEGYHLGYHRGAEIGYEIGFYYGILSALSSRLQDPEVVPRLRTVGQRLASLLDTVPDKNRSDCDILKALETARATFKQLMSLLKLNIAPPVPPSSSF